MQFQCDRATLARALGQVARIVERRITIPILTHCRVEAAAGVLTITGTDLDVEARATLPAEVLEPGAAALPAHMLADIVGKLPDGRLKVEQADTGPALISCGRAKFRVATLPADDLPALTFEEKRFTFTLEPPDLKALLADVAFAMSQDETRYYLNGVFWHRDGDRFVAVATDGHRLARTLRPLPDGIGEMPGVIVPRKASDALVRLFGGATQALQVSLSDTKIRVAAGDLVFTSKLIDGTYPDYQRVIPRENGITASLDRDEFAAAVDRVKTVASDRGTAVRLEFLDGLKISMVNPDAGEASEVIAVKHDGGDITIGFNSRYLGDALEAAGGEIVEMDMADSGSPMLMRAKGRDDFLTLLMPMRV